MKCPRECSIVDRTCIVPLGANASATYNTKRAQAMSVQYVGMDVDKQTESSVVSSLIDPSHEREATCRRLHWARRLDMRAFHISSVAPPIHPWRSPPNRSATACA